MSPKYIEISEQDIQALGKIGVHPDSVEMSESQIAELRKLDLEKLKLELESKNKNSTLLRALKIEVTTPSPTPPLKQKAQTQPTKTEYELGMNETFGTGAWDEAEYIYGALLRHGVMPAKEMGLFQLEANDKDHTIIVKRILHYMLHKMPLVKYIDFPADIGRATYLKPTQWRNAIAENINSMKKDKFDAMLMELQRDKDGNAKLLAALREISTGLKNSQTKKDIDAMITTLNHNDRHLENLWNALNMDKDKVDLKRVADLSVELAQSRAQKGTLIPPPDVKREEIPAMQERVRAEVRPQAMNEEIRIRNLMGEFMGIAGDFDKLIVGADTAIAKLEAGDNKPATEYLKKFGNIASDNNTKIGNLNDQALEKWLALPKLDQNAILKAAAGTAGYDYIAKLASHSSKLGNVAEKSAKLAQARPMRFMYGLIGMVAAGSIGFEFVTGDADVAKNDLLDIAGGFLPGYDIWRAIDGTDLNGRPIQGTDRFIRAGWGVLTVGAALATFGASSFVVGTLRQGARMVKGANTLSHVVKIGSSGMAVATVGHFGYNFVPIPLPGQNFNWKQVLPDGGSPVRIM